MSLLDRILAPPATGDERRADDTTDESPAPTGDDRAEVESPMEPVAEPLNMVPPPPGMEPVHGMRVRRIRLKSFATLALVFWVFSYAVVMASLVLLWNIAQQIGLIDDIEELMVTSLGLETFQIVGQELFNVVALSGALIAGLGLVVSLLMAIVYNASCALFGGLALETTPLRRRRFPLR